MKNSILFSEKLIVRRIQDYGSYTANREIIIADKSHKNNKKKSTNNNVKNNINVSKNRVLKYIELLDEISKKEKDLNELYNRKRNMEKELENDSIMKNLFHGNNEKDESRNFSK